MSVHAGTMPHPHLGTTTSNGNPSASPKALLQAKQLRKLAEEDAVRLANRIEQLKKEEMKALKKITDTRKRAEEIAALRERNAKAKLEKQKREIEQQEEIAKQAKVMQKLKKYGKLVLSTRFSTHLSFDIVYSTHKSDEGNSLLPLLYSYCASILYIYIYISISLYLSLIGCLIYFNLASTSFLGSTSRRSFAVRRCLPRRKVRP